MKNGLIDWFILPEPQPCERPSWGQRCARWLRDGRPSLCVTTGHDPDPNKKEKWLSMSVLYVCIVNKQINKFLKFSFSRQVASRHFPVFAHEHELYSYFFFFFFPSFALGVRQNRTNLGKFYGIPTFFFLGLQQNQAVMQHPLLS